MLFMELLSFGTSNTLIYTGQNSFEVFQLNAGEPAGGVGGGGRRRGGWRTRRTECGRGRENTRGTSVRLEHRVAGAIDKLDN